MFICEVDIVVDDVTRVGYLFDRDTPPSIAWIEVQFIEKMGRKFKFFSTPENPFCKDSKPYLREISGHDHYLDAYRYGLFGGKCSGTK